MLVTVMLGCLLLGCKRHDQRSLTGIGVQFAMRDNLLEVMQVVPGTPAAKAGVARGMIVLAVDGTNTTGMPLRKCVEMMRGTVGTTVRLAVVDRQKDTPNTVELTREEIRF